MKVHVSLSLIQQCQLLNRVQLLATSWTVAHQAPLSLEFSTQEYWSGQLFSSPGDLLNPGIKPASPKSPALQEDSLPSEPPRKPHLKFKKVWPLICSFKNHFWCTMASGRVSVLFEVREIITIFTALRIKELVTGRSSINSRFHVFVI